MITDGLFWLVVAGSVPAFWIIPQRFRLGFLGIASYGYLLTLDVPSVLALTMFMVAFYFLAPYATGPRKVPRATSMLVVAVLGYLVYFKYLPRLMAVFRDDSSPATIVIPLGVSYFTFKLIHYAVEVGRKTVRAHSFADFMCYLFLFPVFTAGPIERFDHFEGAREPEWSARGTADGLIRIAHGLVKKLVVANLLLLPLLGSVTNASELVSRLPELPTFKVWGFVVISFLYSYVDFSAYSDIAIGTSRLYGLRIAENFDWPVLATDIGAFWKRWHMSLSTWCQTYIYMPMIGLTRNPYLASYASFVLMGTWHNGTLGWMLWGAWHATGVATFVYWSRLKRRKKWRGLDRQGWRWLGLPPTLAFVSAGSVFPMMSDMPASIDAVRILFKLAGIDV